MRSLFRGPTSLAYPGERLAFWLTLLFAFPAAGLIGFFIHEQVGFAQVALFIVIAMIYVTLARGQLVGSSVRIHETQYPRVFAIVKRCAGALALPLPLVFVRDDYKVPVVALGLGEPYTLVISSNWIEHFQDDELAFMIGRELGHITAGHTRLTSLLSVNGNTNPVIALIFGAWLRRCELGCDRVGLLCCGSLDAATRAIAIASFHHFGRNIDYTAFAEQSRDVKADPFLRLGEWLGAFPYATARIDAMRTFVASELYAAHAPEFARDANPEPPALPETGGLHVQRKDCAGWWRRFAAWAIDAIVVVAIFQTIFFGGGSRHPHTSVNATISTARARDIAKTRTLFTYGPFSGHASGILVRGKTRQYFISWDEVVRMSTLALGPVSMALYFMLLVGVVGQTPGMAIAGLRVVRTDFSRPSPLQTIWRYILAFWLWWLAMLLSPFSRIYVHDALSGTRLIKSERVLARIAA